MTCIQFHLAAFSFSSQEAGKREAVQLCTYCSPILPQLQPRLPLPVPPKGRLKQLNFVSSRQTCIANGFQFMPGSVGCAGPMPLLTSSSSTQPGVSLPLIQRGTSSSVPFILKSGARGFRLPMRLSQNWVGFSSRYLHLSSIGELEVCRPGTSAEALSNNFQQLA